MIFSLVAINIMLITLIVSMCLRDGQAVGWVSISCLGPTLPFFLFYHQHGAFMGTKLTPQEIQALKDRELAHIAEKMGEVG